MAMMQIVFVSRYPTLYGCQVSKSQYELKINLTDTSGTKMLSENRTADTCPAKRTFDVVFHRKVKLSEDVDYELSVKIDGEKSYYGGRGQESVTTGGVTFKFTNCKIVPNNGTNLHKGQIPGLIFQTMNLATRSPAYFFIVWLVIDE